MDLKFQEVKKTKNRNNRALISNPKIIILDEATSALDKRY